MKFATIIVALLASNATVVASSDGVVQEQAVAAKHTSTNELGKSIVLKEEDNVFFASDAPADDEAAALKENNHKMDKEAWTKKETNLRGSSEGIQYYVGKCIEEKCGSREECERGSADYADGCYEGGGGADSCYGNYGNECDNDGWLGKAGCGKCYWKSAAPPNII